MTQSGALDPESVNEIARSFWYSAILRAGMKLDVFSILELDALASDEFAQRIEASPKYVEAFLESRVVIGLLEKDGDRYRNSESSTRFLIKGKPDYVGDHVLHHTNTWMSFGRLDEAIREGKTILPFETGFIDAPTYWTNYMMGQHNRATSGQGHQLVTHVDLTDRHKLIDLGGGAASYSIALCEANPGLSAVVVDRKEPLEVARPLVKEQGLQDRIEFLEGSFFDVDLGKGYDVALISGVVLITPEEGCRQLFSAAYDALEPGGMMIVQDYMRLENDPERHKLDTLENMYVMTVFSPDASDREGAEIASWLEDAGFHNTQKISLPTQLGLVVAEKPS